MMLVKRILLGFFLLPTFIVPSFVYALDLRTGSDISVPFVESDENRSENNIYIVSGNSHTEDKIKGDLSVLSGETTISGVIEKDLLVGAGKVTLTGEVFGDVRLAGGDVIIKGIVHGDTVVLGGDVRIEDGSDLRGDILIAGGRVFVDAPITSFLKIVGGHITINDKLSGNTEITTQQLIFTDKAEVSGTLLYFSPTSARQNEDTVLSGEINFNQINSITDSTVFKKVVLNFINFWVLLQFVTTLLISFLLVYIFKVFSQEVSDYALNSFWKSILFGILSIVLIPIISIIFFISLIALPISIMLMLTLTFMFVLAYSVAGIIVGMLIHKVMKKGEDPTVSFQSATIGVILLTVLQFVPYIGDLTRFIFFIIAIGTMSHYIYRHIRFNKTI